MAKCSVPTQTALLGSRPGGVCLGGMGVCLGLCMGKYLPALESQLVHTKTGQITFNLILGFVNFKMFFPQVSVVCDIVYDYVYV